MMQRTKRKREVKILLTNDSGGYQHGYEAAH